MASNFLPLPPVHPGNVGIALIVANDYRDTSKRYLSGTESDAHKMVGAFTFLGYQTILKRNVSRDVFVMEYKKLASYNYSLCRCKRIVLVFSGHGGIDENERGVLIMQDEEKVTITELVDEFKATNNGNHTLTTTTRMFFIDACRGDMEEPRVVSRSPRGGQFIDQKSSEAGILIAYSTTENHKAYECNNGGFWIQLLAQEICTSNESILTVLTRVNKKLNEQCNRLPNAMQTAQTVSQLTEDVYFLRERPKYPPQPVAEPVAASFMQPTIVTPLNELPISNDQPLEPSNLSTGVDQGELLRETLTSQGITCQYHFTETASRQLGGRPSYSCELNCHSNGTNYKFHSKQSYSNRDDAKRDVNEQASQSPGIGHSEIFSRSLDDHTSRVDKLADYCKRQGYRQPSYNTKRVASNCYITTVLVPRNGKFEGKEAESVEKAKEMAAKKALLDLGVIVDSLSLL